MYVTLGKQPYKERRQFGGRLAMRLQTVILICAKSTITTKQVRLVQYSIGVLGVFALGCKLTTDKDCQKFIVGDHAQLSMLSLQQVTPCRAPISQKYMMPDAIIALHLLSIHQSCQRCAGLTYLQPFLPKIVLHLQCPLHRCSFRRHCAERQIPHRHLLI